MAKKKSESGPGFEQSLKQLEEIVRRLEEEEIPLETSLQLFADGQRLVRACEAQLRAADNRVRELLENAQGEITEQDLEVAAEDRCGAVEDLVEAEGGKTQAAEDSRPLPAAEQSPPLRPAHPDDEELPF